MLNLLVIQIIVCPFLLFLLRLHDPADNGVYDRQATISDVVGLWQFRVEEDTIQISSFGSDEAGALEHGAQQTGGNHRQFQKQIGSELVSALKHRRQSNGVEPHRHHDGRSVGAVSVPAFPDARLRRHGNGSMHIQWSDVSDGLVAKPDMRPP